jgi:hypothetical protein
LGNAKKSSDNVQRTPLMTEFVTEKKYLEGRLNVVNESLDELSSLAEAQPAKSDRDGKDDGTHLIKFRSTNPRAASPYRRKVDAENSKIADVKTTPRMDACEKKRPDAKLKVVMKPWGVFRFQQLLWMNCHRGLEQPYTTLDETIWQEAINSVGDHVDVEGKYQLISRSFMVKQIFATKPCAANPYWPKVDVDSAKKSLDVQPTPLPLWIDVWLRIDWRRYGQNWQRGPVMVPSS